MFFKAKTKIVDELKSFYYQNVMSHFFIVTALLSAIVLELLQDDLYWIIALSSIFPFAYELASEKLKTTSKEWYYKVGLYLNSIIFAMFIYAISFEPSLSGLLVLMFTYTLISYGGWKLFLLLFPSLVVHLSALIYFFPVSGVIHVPVEMVASSLVAACCFMAVIASYRYDAGEELIESKLSLKRVLNKQSSLTSSLSKYLSPKLVETLVNGDDSIEKHQRKEIVVFFSDLCNFTSISEEMSPEDMSLILNQYLSKMSDIANEYDATIDKFIGDSVMVFFGAPNSFGPKEDVLRCLKMASAMRMAMIDLNKSWRDAGYSHNFKVRMGIHQGWATIGNFGAKNQVNYTAIGTAVNIAARLEQNCSPNHILVSRRIVDLAQDEFEFSPQCEMDLKGIESPVETYLLQGRHEYGSRKVRLVIEANENTVDNIRWELRKAGVVAKIE